MNTYKIDFDWYDDEYIERNDTYYSKSNSAKEAVEQFKKWAWDCGANGLYINKVYIDTRHGWESQEVEW